MASGDIKDSVPKTEADTAVSDDTRNEVFIRAGSLKPGTQLKPGQRVVYDVMDTPQGRVAYNIRVL